VLAWVVRLLLFLAAPVAARFVSRDELNFGVVEMLVATMMIAGIALDIAVWKLRTLPSKRNFPY
jgi:hypothetical protein